MIDQTEPLTDAAEVVDDATTNTEPANSSPSGTDAEPDDGKPSNREAARYRARLRDTEQQLAGATAVAEAAQRQLVEHLATGHKIKPEALWASGARLVDLLGDDGGIDPDKVKQACDVAVESLGLHRRRPPAPDTSQGRGNAAARGSWLEAFAR